MNSDFIWEKEAFKGSYLLYADGLKIGNMFQSALSRRAVAEFNGRGIYFKSSGILKLMTLIYDKNKTVIGSIKFNILNSSAKVTLHDKSFCLKNYNFWTSKWELTGDCGTMIKLQGNSSKGCIESKMEDGDLVLCGLFVANQFWQSRLGIWAAILVPLWINYLLYI